MGLPQAWLDEAEDTEPDPLEIWPENWPVVEVFLALSTQWNMVAMVGPTGINYPAMETIFRIYKVENQREMLDDLQVMERAALRAFKGANDGA